MGTRALLLLVAFVNGTLRHHAFTHELSKWDGLWYRDAGRPRLSNHVMHVQSTLGFFPLYPLPSGRCHTRSSCPSRMAGSVYDDRRRDRVGHRRGPHDRARAASRSRLVGGTTGRRAVLIFCLFPGSVVFSMVYAEGVMLALVAGCILALQRRRWVLAGALAGFATATEPEAIGLVAVCVVSARSSFAAAAARSQSALRSLSRRRCRSSGWGRSVFLWMWTGKPFASLIAQRDGWSEKTNVFALGQPAGERSGRGLAQPLQPPDDQPQSRRRAHRRGRPDRHARARRPQAPRDVG